MQHIPHLNRRKLLTGATSMTALSLLTPNIAHAIAGEDCIGGRSLPTTASSDLDADDSAWKSFWTNMQDYQNDMADVLTGLGGTLTNGAKDLVEVGATGPLPAVLVVVGINLSVHGGYTQAGAAVSGLIAGDPPREDYKVLSNCSTTRHSEAHDVLPALRTLDYLTQTMFTRSASTLAALELYQGAELAGDEDWSCTHATDYLRAGHDAVEVARALLQEHQRFNPMITQALANSNADLSQLSERANARSEAQFAETKAQIAAVLESTLVQCETEAHFVRDGFEAVHQPGMSAALIPNGLLKRGKQLVSQIDALTASSG